MSGTSTPEVGTYSAPEAAARGWEKVVEAPQQLSQEHGLPRLLGVRARVGHGY